MDSINILGVRVDKVKKSEAIDLVKSWIEAKSLNKHFIVTTNPEFVLDAQDNFEFKKILNEADLSLPDSPRLAWAGQMLKTKNLFKRLWLLPRFLVTDTVSTIPGVDFMESLIKLSSEKGFTVGFFGGRNMVAEKVSERLKKKYQNLKVVLAEDGPEVNMRGEMINDYRLKNNESKRKNDPDLLINHQSLILNLPKVDILFVAFGHIKQEKWIYKNLDNIPVKVAMGVGGSFDYLSGEVARAPKVMRELGYEWLFRLILQPWRISRQIRLIKFVWKVFWSFDSNTRSGS